MATLFSPAAIVGQTRSFVFGQSTQKLSSWVKVDGTLRVVNPFLTQDIKTWYTI